MRSKRFYTISLALLTIGFFLIDQYVFSDDEKTNSDSSEKEDKAYTNTFYLPASTTNQVIHHQYYSLSYHEAYEQAEWVAYELKRRHLSKANRKRPYFETDPDVHSGSAHWKNYKNSGFDRGHYCPAGDRRFSLEAYNETFLTSNVAPQRHGFNSGVWNRLEQKVRYWAQKYDGVFVVTGGILNNQLNTIGAEEVAVPEFFYKIVLDNKNGKYHMIAFLIPHKASNEALKNFVVSVDTLEKLTGIDFFEKLPDDQEIPKEASASTKEWKF